MGRKCSHCGNMGHNSRTCITYRGSVAGGSVRIFGVQLGIPSSSSLAMKKCFSMDCLSSSSLASSSSPSSSSSSSRVSVDENSDKMAHGYLSDGLICQTQERRKGDFGRRMVLLITYYHSMLISFVTVLVSRSSVEFPEDLEQNLRVPWTEEEHKTFLAGLEKLGKGDWRGISRSFVITRTPTQVASHAQKHFLRQTSLKKKKHRSSLFDVVRSRNMADHHVNTTNCKPNDPSLPYGLLPIPTASLKIKTGCNEAHEETTLPLIDLKPLEQDTKLDNQETHRSQSPLCHDPMPIWAYGSFDSLPTSSNAAPNLELSLAGPRPLDQMSNNITAILNLIALLTSVPIIGAGIWLASKQDNECIHLFRWPVLIIGVLILLVSLSGFVGAYWNRQRLLLFYLFCMALLILLLLLLLIFFFVVTRPDGGFVVPGRAYKEYRLKGFSSWLRNHVTDSGNWRKIRTCLAQSSFCAKLSKDYTTADQFFMAHVSPLQARCCKPPTVCGFGYVNPTLWTNAANPTADPDCNMWNNDQSQLCYGCNACKAGLLGNLRKEWRKANVILIVAVVALICVYLIACSAFKNAQTEDLFKRYKQGWT
ncbi:hypothetical protein HHK36_014284 [Tetracentron sinense]|uniref:Uncharacterized protein n=1 Tax=Tetracentron sinense TaxID=13715 RepID=A0A835DF98_TETSI|nr:hypothetical protein HHK36_014284 [Tetracentron sinense]